MAASKDMKRRFNEQVHKLKLTKGKNTQLFSRDEYYSFLSKVQVAKDKVAGKTPEEYQRLSRYDIVKIGTVQKLIVPVKNDREPIQYYCYLEETFDVIHKTHISIGHGGRDRMMKELKLKYKNITKEFVALYLALCEPCQKRKYVPKKIQVVKTIKNSEFSSRGQVDLIDMQTQADNDFRFIMVYQDHFTKFVILRPLKTKRAEEVAYHLLDIFTTFGAPCILYSDNGREFVNEVIDERCQMWEKVKIVHGKPHSQSQGSEERANQDIEKMVFKWLETNKTTKWSEGLRFIQLMKNSAHHSDIDRSPYEAMFGCRPKVGLKSVLPSFDALTEIVSEDDLEAMRSAGDAVNEDSDNIDENSAAVTDSITVTIGTEPRYKLEQQSADIQLENQQSNVDIINENPRPDDQQPSSELEQHSADSLPENQQATVSVDIIHGNPRAADQQPSDDMNYKKENPDNEKIASLHIIKDQEAIEDTNTNTSETNDFNEATASTSKRSMTPTPVKKRKHPSETRESTFHMKKLKYTKKTSQEQRRPTNLDDECTIFGQLIAKKMRKLADERRDVMMVKINQLFVDEHTIKSPKRSYSDSTSSNSTGTPSPPHIKVEYSPRAHTQTDPLDEENTTVDSVTFVVSNDE